MGTPVAAPEVYPSRGGRKLLLHFAAGTPAIPGGRYRLRGRTLSAGVSGQARTTEVRRMALAE
jgi:hypothetical protein